MDLPASRAAVGLLLLLTAFIAGSEFAVDLMEFPRWRAAVTVVDRLLVVALWVKVLVGALRTRLRLRAYLTAQRIDLVLLLVSVPLWWLLPRAMGILIVGRVLSLVADVLLETASGRKLLLQANLRPSQTLALSFLGLITFGTIMLALPASTVDGAGASITDAAFTASSATSVTGLVVQDTGTYFTAFGKLVLLFIMQTGAIGIMVLAASFGFLVGGRMPQRQQETFEEAGFGGVINVQSVDEMKRLVASVTAATLAIELLGAAVLFGLWATGVMPLRAEYDSVGGAMWWSLFHSVSGFCHAGFSLEPDSLVTWVTNPLVCGVFVVLITLGGLGFPVLADLRPKGLKLFFKIPISQAWRRLHIQTRVVLWMTLLLNVAGMLLFLFYEYDGVLAPLGVGAKLNAALFQAVTLRSAGFNTVDITGLAAPTVVIALVWMFVGSAPASTGGGIRVTTLAVVVLAIRTMLRGRDDVEVMGRTLPRSIVYRSISIALIAGMIVTTFTVLVLATQKGTFMALAFETFSAFGTVGLSMGATGDLDATGKWLLTVLMFFGRVGPLTLALAVGERTLGKAHRYAEGRIAVG